VKSLLSPVTTSSESTERKRPVVYVSGKAFVPKGSTVGKPISGPTKIPTGSNVNVSVPAEIKEKPKQSLVTVTNSIAESISSLVLESSDSTLLSSAVFSDAIGRQTEKLSDQTGDENLEVARVISAYTNELSSKSVAMELDDTLRASLSNACLETHRTSMKLSDEIAAKTHMNSVQIAKDVDPISSHTRTIQAAATEGLEDHLSQGVDALVRDIMMATKTAVV
jgi:hypothetical protein